MRLLIGFFVFLTPVLLQAAAPLDLAVNNGRVMDPASGLDAIRHLGVRDGVIVRLSKQPLQAKRVVDAGGLVVAPGFIDLHVHGQDAVTNAFQVADGVTTALELEIGVYPVSTWLESRKGRSRTHFGASAGHLSARVKLMTDVDVPHVATGGMADNPAWLRSAAMPLSADQLDALDNMIADALADGGLGVGLGISYVPAATREEIYRMFAVAARTAAPVFTHIRQTAQNGGDVLGPVQEVLADAVVSGAPLHIVHLHANTNTSAPLVHGMIRSLVGRGFDITTETYPYTAGSTRLESAIFENYQGDYGQLQWTETGEFLNAESFARYRKQGGWVIIHGRDEASNAWLIGQPDVMIASDSVPYVDGKSHPRSAGTFARVLGHYVRERQTLTLMAALKKMTIDPANRLAAISSDMQKKGRIATGADADITIFDSATIIDRASYLEPDKASAGIRYVIVGGVPVIDEGVLVEDAYPGTAVRAGL